MCPTGPTIHSAIWDAFLFSAKDSCNIWTMKMNAILCCLTSIVSAWSVILWHVYVHRFDIYCLWLAGRKPFHVLFNNINISNCKYYCWALYTRSVALFRNKTKQVLNLSYTYVNNLPMINDHQESIQLKEWHIRSRKYLLSEMTFVRI